MKVNLPLNWRKVSAGCYRNVRFSWELLRQNRFGQPWQLYDISGRSPRHSSSYSSLHDAFSLLAERGRVR